MKPHSQIPVDQSLEVEHNSNHCQGQLRSKRSCSCITWGHSAILYPTRYLLAKNKGLTSGNFLQPLDSTSGFHLSFLVSHHSAFCLKLELPLYLACSCDHLHWEGCLAFTDFSTWRGLPLSWVLTQATESRLPRKLIPHPTHPQLPFILDQNANTGEK